MIIVECSPDALLVRAITNIARRDIIHELKGKGGVCNRLSERRNCKGLIDEDPSSAQPHYLGKLHLQDNLIEEGVKLLRDNASDNSVVLLCPDLENWILKAAKVAGADVARYGLPADPQKLHRLINLRLDEFEVLLNDLVRTSRRIATLKRLLESAP